MIFGTSHRCTRRQAMTALGTLALLAPLAGCGGSGTNPNPTPTPTTASITGRVVNANNSDSGVSGATIQFNGLTTVTGVDGTFTLSTPSTTTSGFVTVTGPGNAYYNAGYQAGTLYNNLTASGFPIDPLPGGTVRSVGTIRIASTDGPPFPPSL